MIPKLLAVMGLMSVIGVAITTLYPHVGISSPDSLMVSLLVGVFLGLVGVWIYMRWIENDW